MSILFSRKNLTLFACTLYISVSLPAQENQGVFNFYEHIQPILQKNCVGCHRPGEIGPFPLLTYEDVEKRATFIKDVTQARFMPPWHADPAFQTYHNQRILSDADLQTIATWVEQGKKKGKLPKKGKKTSQNEAAATLPDPDLIYEMQRDFEIPGDNSEQFRIFVIPTNLPDDVYVRGAAFLPGNRKLAHHARVMVDTTNQLRADNGIQVGASSEFGRTGVKLYDEFWMGWVPGNMPVFYPEGMAKKLPKNADLVINMHYSPTPVPANDRSKIRLYLAPKKPEILIKTFVLGENWVTNQPFFIPADTLIRFYMRSPLLPMDLHLISVLPHMHKLGKTFKAYAITPAGDLIPLIKIDHWDFNWQTTYQFNGRLTLPKGSVIYAEATYDNQVTNPDNPNFPPQDVSYGWGTNNEMMNLIFEYFDAVKGRR